MAERIFQVVAAVIALVAVYFLLSGNTERAFIAGVVGAVCFFLSVRFAAKKRIADRAAAKEEADVDTAEKEA